jgi:hypothetical protein
MLCGKKNVSAKFKCNPLFFGPAAAALSVSIPKRIQHALATTLYKLQILGRQPFIILVNVFKFLLENGQKNLRRESTRFVQHHC